MKRIYFAIAAFALAAPAVGQAPITVPSFDSIELQGGGQLTVRYGTSQRVTILTGDREISRFTVERGRLKIETCIRSCRNYTFHAEIVTPDIDALAIRGGGAIRVDDTFPRTRELAIAITGGGAIDSRQIAASDVAASISGGGVIRTQARDNLAVSINGGGTVRYVGDPERTIAINGGGNVHRDSR